LIVMREIAREITEDAMQPPAHKPSLGINLCFDVARIAPARLFPLNPEEVVDRRQVSGVADCPIPQAMLIDHRACLPRLLHRLSLAADRGESCMRFLARCSMNPHSCSMSFSWALQSFSKLNDAARF